MKLTEKTSRKWSTICVPPIVLHVPENPRAMQPIIGASKQRLRWKSRSSVFCLVETRILPHCFRCACHYGLRLVTRSGINDGQRVTSCLGYIHGLTWEKVFRTGQGNKNPWACLLHQMKAFPPAGTFPLKTQPPASRPMVRSRPKPVCVNPTGKKQRGFFTRMQSSRFANAKTVTVNTFGVPALPRIKPSWADLMWPVSARLTCFPLGFMWLLMVIFGIIGLTLPCSCRSMC